MKVRTPKLDRDHAIHVLSDYITEGLRRKRKGELAHAQIEVASALRDLVDASARLAVQGLRDRDETDEERELRIQRDELTRERQVLVTLKRDWRRLAQDAMRFIPTATNSDSALVRSMLATESQLVEEDGIP